MNDTGDSLTMTAIPRPLTLMAPWLTHSPERPEAPPAVFWLSRSSFPPFCLELVRAEIFFIPLSALIAPLSHLSPGEALCPEGLE